METAEVVYQGTPVEESETSTRRSGFGSRLLGLLGWLWCIFIGTILCFNFFLVSYITSIIVFGWTYRWMQTVVLYGWWKKSRFSQEGTFQEFCSQLDRDDPVARPRWFIAERKRWSLSLHSLLLNFKLGVQGLFSTYLLMGWGCLIMLLSWEFGWLNSYHKGYELAFVGPLTGMLGSLLLIAALIYVPMAQAHQAMSGQMREFFHFSLVRRLIRARLLSYVGLAAVTVLLSLVLEILRIFVINENFIANDRSLAPEDALLYLRRYFFACAAVLFVSLLALRTLTAVIYRSALLRALQFGWVTRDELPHNIRRWLHKLDITPKPVRRSSGLKPVLSFALWVLWIGFVVQFYVGYFLVANGYIGFLNHPLFQFPCFDYVPLHLQIAAGG